MKISKNVREKFKLICHRSTAKCQSFAEVDYKIHRAVNLGHETKFKNESIVGYHNLVFTIRNNVIVDMRKLEPEEGYIHVPEHLKINYYNTYYKVVV